VLDYGARFYDPVIGRFSTIDRNAEKYFEVTPYQYALNNPNNNIDINGDSVYVDKDHIDNMNSALKAIFGDNSSKFGYNQSGMLTYSGDTKSFTSELSALFEGLYGVMGDKATTNMIFGESTTIKLTDGSTKIVKSSDGGGAVTVLLGENKVSQNTILIDPKSAGNPFSVYAVTDVYYKTPIDPKGGARFEKKEMPSNLASSTFHEIGNVIYKGKRKIRY